MKIILQTLRTHAMFTRYKVYTTWTKSSYYRSKIYKRNKSHHMQQTKYCGLITTILTELFIKPNAAIIPFTQLVAPPKADFYSHITKGDLLQ